MTIFYEIITISNTNFYRAFIETGWFSSDLSTGQSVCS